MAYLGNTLINGSLRCLNKAYFNDLSIGSDVEIAGKTTTNQLVINSANNPNSLATTNSSTGGVPLVIGNPTGRHIAMDADEIAGKTGVTTGSSLWINYGGGKVFLSNGTKIYADNGTFKADSLGASDSRIPNAYITTLDATTGNITTLKTSTVHAENLTVYDTLKSSKWDISSVANLANDFMVAPTIKISSSGTVNIASLNTTAKTCTLTFSDATQINSDEFGGCKWYKNSKVRVTFVVNGTLNSNIEGIVKNNMNTSAGSLAIDVTLDNITGLANGTYNATDATIMLYEMASGSNLYPVGIRMTAYGTNNSSYIDMYGGTASTDYTHPIVRIGRLNGITFNGKTFGTNELPAAWGIYTLNGYFEGAIVANEGKIANFTIASDKLYTGTHSAWNANEDGIFINNTYISFGKQALTYFKNDGTGKIGNWKIDSISLYNGTFGTANSAMVSTGTNTSKQIGGSENISGWTFTSGANFGVTKTGALYASDVNISGAVNATALHVGSSSSTNHLIYENSTIDLQTDWLKFDNSTETVVIGKINSPRITLDGQSMKLLNIDDESYFLVGDRRINGLYTFTAEHPYIVSYITEHSISVDYSINEDYPVTVLDENDNEIPYDRISYHSVIVSESYTFSNDGLYKVLYTTSEPIYTFKYLENDNFIGCGAVSFADDGKAYGNYSFVEGYNTTASRFCCHAEGSSTTASKYCSHAEGSSTTASGYISHAEGSSTTASGRISHAEGGGTIASGDYSHAEGYKTTVSYGYGHAEGYKTTASGYGSHSEGVSTTASESSSHAEGSSTIASGSCSHAEGSDTIASEYCSHAEGRETVASGYISHASGDHTYATEQSQTVIGKYNVVTTSTDSNENTVYNAGDYALIIGNGTADDNRSNALTVDWKGQIKTYNPNLTAGTAPSSTNSNMALCLADKEGTRMGDVSYYYSDTDSIGISVSAYRKVSDENKYNALRLSLDSNGNPAVMLSYPSAWRTALGLSNILDMVRVVEFKKTNVSIGANTSLSPVTITATAPTGFSFVSIVGWRIDTSDTTSGANSVSCVVTNYWGSTTLSATVRNYASSAAKVTVNLKVLYRRTTL